MGSMCAMITGHEGPAEEKGIHLSVSEYLTVCSRLGHLLFFLFRHNRTKFIAAQNYRNWQDTIKIMFVNVSLSRKHGIEHFYFFLNTNKRLEQLFGILQFLRRGDLNFSCLELRDRIGDAGLIQLIYSEFLEWGKTPRRLTNSMDRKNTKSWEGDTSVANVDVAMCWKDGRDDAIKILRDGGIFSDEDLDIKGSVSDEPGVDMLCPYQNRIGVLAGDSVLGVGILVDLTGIVDDEVEEMDN